MGYRNYLGTIPKKEYNKIKKFTYEELYKHYNVDKVYDVEDCYMVPYDIVKQIYEYGKYCDFETKGLFKPFFKNKETQNRIDDSDTEFKIITKEFVEMTIKNYTEKIQKYYTDMLDGTREMLESGTMTLEKQVKLYDHIRSMSYEWLQMTPYDLNRGDSVTTSWKYEYELFELIRIYKHFDWEKNIMVYYGY